MGNAPPQSEAVSSVCGEDGVTPRLYELAVKAPPSQWPIIYSPNYNISFMGLEKVHPFDAAKWGKVVKFLIGELCGSIRCDMQGVLFWCIFPSGCEQIFHWVGHSIKCTQKMSSLGNCQIVF